MLAVYDANGTLIAGLTPVQLPQTPFKSELLQTVTNNSQSWYVFDLHLKPAGMDGGIWLRGSASLSSIYATRDEILLQCALLFPFLILLSGFGGYLLTKKAFKPVRQITAAAEHIGSGSDLSQRINMHNADREIMELAQTFDSMFSRLENHSTLSGSLLPMLLTSCAHRQRSLSRRQNTPCSMPNPMKKMKPCRKYWHRPKMSRLLAQLLMLARADANKIQFEIENLISANWRKLYLKKPNSLPDAKKLP